jgi:endoglucanase
MELVSILDFLRKYFFDHLTPTLSKWRGISRTFSRSLFYFFAFIFLFQFHFLVKAQEVTQHGKLWVDGIQLKNEHNQPVVLRGVSFGWHNWWSQFYNKEAVQWLHQDWKCNVVRAAMGIEPDSGFIQKKTWSKELIVSVVDAAIEEDMYVIIDWHSHNINLQEAKDFFAEMAQKYADKPHVIYEIFNEPDYESWKKVKKYSIEIIETIRKYDADNIILVGSPHWDQDIDVVADSPLVGFKNIMYSVHFYAATHKKELRDKCDYALKKNIPIFISESAGMEASGDGNLNDDEWNQWIEWAEKNKISWITWSISSKNETCSMLNTSASPTGNWTAQDLKESGIKTRALLKKFAENK